MVGVSAEQAGLYPEGREVQEEGQAAPERLYRVVKHCRHNGKLYGFFYINEIVGDFGEATKLQDLLNKVKPTRGELKIPPAAREDIRHFHKQSLWTKIIQHLRGCPIRTFNQIKIISIIKPPLEEILYEDAHQVVVHKEVMHKYINFNYDEVNPCFSGFVTASRQLTMKF